MFTKALFALPFAAFALIAAKRRAARRAPHAEHRRAGGCRRQSGQQADARAFERRHGGDPASARPCAQARRAHPDFGAPGLLQRPQLPPRDPRLHGPGRRSQGHGRGRIRRFPTSRPSSPLCRSCAGRSARRAGDNPDSANSQFFIMFIPNASMNGHYTVFGRVISGMDAVDKIAPGRTAGRADENCEGARCGG